MKGNSYRPIGRTAKRTAVYALKRREAQGRAVVRGIRGHMPEVLPAPPVSPAVGLVRDEWDLTGRDRSPRKV